MVRQRALLVLGALSALAAAALGALWIWAGSAGSLQRTLQWVGARQPLVAEQVSGALLGGGTIGTLTWEQDGLRVEVQDAALRWSPRALLAGRLQIDTLAARRITIEDHRAPTPPSAGPPESLALPLKLRVASLRVDELRWAGPPAYTLARLAGRYAFDGTHHQLDIDHAEIEGGHYRARALLQARAPMRLDLALAGAWVAPVPQAGAAVPLTLRATLRGPITALQAQADVQAAPTGAEPDLPALAPPAAAQAPTRPNGATPSAHASARITPWGAQPLPEAHARLHALDVGALWAHAPRTALSGQIDLAPLATTPGWSLAADFANAAPGPWDERALPLRTLRAQVDWANGVATIHALRAELAGGSVQASGRWAAPASAAAADAAEAGWAVRAQIDGVDPAGLHSQLAALPLDGSVTAHGEGAAIAFEGALQARAQARATNDLQALRLQTLSATGRWADATLTLQQLRLRTADARLDASARIQPRAQGGQAQATVQLPGATLRLDGALWPGHGDGTLQLDVGDAAQVLAWARRLPLATRALAGAEANGQARLDARWSGGWSAPQVRARLAAPRADLRLQGGAPIALRELALALDGSLADATVSADGRVAQGAHALTVRLRAQGGRTTPQAPLATSGWRARIDTLALDVQAPALGDGHWQLASGEPVTIDWSPAGGGQLAASAGHLAVTAPLPGAPAQLAWGPVRWQAGELTSTGRITGLPLRWAERLAGETLAQAGLGGDVVFEGAWDLAFARQLRLRAHLARASGDLALTTTDEETGVATRAAAGLREARIDLTGDGAALQARLAWDSALAGRVDATLTTELRPPAAAGATGWAWPASAPLHGQVRAELPQISAWSLFAPPGWRLRGSLAADLRLEGTRAAPQLHGTLNAERLALRSVVDGLRLGRGQLRARLDGTRLVIDEFTLHGPGAQGAGGLLTARGDAGWIDGRAQARLAVTLDHLRASVRADREVTVSGNVNAALHDRTVHADGRLHVDQARIELPDEGTPALGDDVVIHAAEGRQARGADAPALLARPAPATPAARTDSAGTKPPLDVQARVQIDLGDDLRVSGMGVSTRLAGALQVSASGPITAAPRITGSVRTEGGTVHAYSQQLEITRGLVTFSGAADNPALDIVALRPNYTGDQRVGVQVAGSALLPRVRLYSEPQLPDSQALAWLLLGRAAPDTGAEAAMLQSAALALLGGREGSSLASRFGLDELSFNGGGADGIAGSSVMLGKRLSDRLYAAYEHSIAGASGTLLIFYELSRRWSLRGQAGVDSAVDLIYRLSFDG